MRKFLSLLLAAVLICSTVLLPTSAVEMTEQEPPLAIYEEQELIQPRVVGDQVTYHIIFEKSGKLASAISNTITSANYVQNSNFVQWVFEEYLTAYGIYIVRYKPNPSYVLATDSSGNVALVSENASGYNKWWVIDTIGDYTYLKTDSNLDGIGERYLCYSANTITTSATSNDDCWVLLIIPELIIPVTSITIENIELNKNTSTSAIPSIDFEPMNASYSINQWLTFNSSNTSICTIDSNGIITVHSSGIATITVRHKLFNITDTFQVIVGPFTYYSVSAIVCNQFEPFTAFNMNDFDLHLAQAVEAFKNEFGIDIMYAPAHYHVNPMLNVDRGEEECAVGVQTQYTAQTQYNYQHEKCTAECGNINQCYQNHHKSGANVVIYNGITYNPENSFITIGVVDYIMCNNTYVKLPNASTILSHVAVVGTHSTDYSKSIAVTIVDGNVSRILQHELSHVLGASHDTCEGGALCMMDSGDMGVWCNACSNSIRNEGG